jgi:hypothetical protein
MLTPWLATAFAAISLRSENGGGILGHDTGERKRSAILLQRGARALRLMPYPRTGSSDAPVKAKGLPARPKIGAEPHSAEEKVASEAYIHMHQVLARIEECEAALEDPENLWDRLRDAWLSMVRLRWISPFRRYTVPLSPTSLIRRPIFRRDSDLDHEGRPS